MVKGSSSCDVGEDEMHRLRYIVDQALKSAIANAASLQLWGQAICSCLHLDKLKVPPLAETSYLICDWSVGYEC